VIEIQERFAVPSPPARVWAVISDPPAVVGCVPGASLCERGEDGSFEAAMAVKFGPLKVAFKAHVGLALDHSTMTGQITAHGKDSQGGTRVRSDVTFRVAEQPELPGSTVSIDGSVDISGKLASLIEGGATVVVNRMAAEFAEQLAARCGGQAA
jgi:uncharacterized protein